MDIFEIAQEGIKIQEEDKQRELEEAEAEKNKSKHKLDIHALIKIVAKKDYGWLLRDDKQRGDPGYNKEFDYGVYYTAEEKEKGFSPFMLNMWLGFIQSPNTSRQITALDQGYFYILRRVNSELNANVFSASKGMNWLLACSINPFDTTFDPKFVKKAKREAETKYDKRVITYMAKELWSSEDKIYDMIESGLISDEEMKAIGKDLDTLEDPTKKKK